MWNGFKNLDRILRGEATRPSLLSRGTIDVAPVGLTAVLIVLAMAYGASMGCYSIIRPGGGLSVQILASTIKIPLLFFLTLVVTLPSLYVFNALVGSRLTFDMTVRLLLAALGVMLAVLAAFGPIVAFFSASTKSYSFMLLFNVAIFAAAGVFGCLFLLQTLQRLSVPPGQPRPIPKVVSREVPSSEVPEAIAEGSAEPRSALATIADAVAEGQARPEPKDLGALEPVEDQVLHDHVRTVFRLWVVLFGVVGAQMGWVLRPFLGNPTVPFAWFRERDSNFFEAVYRAFASLFS